MPTTPPLEGPRVADAIPLVSLAGTLAPLEIVLTERLRLIMPAPERPPEPSLEARLDGVRVADAPPVVSLEGAVITPPLARLITERIRAMDRPIRIRRVRPR